MSDSGRGKPRITKGDMRLQHARLRDEVAHAAALLNLLEKGADASMLRIAERLESMREALILTEEPR